MIADAKFLQRPIFSRWQISRHLFEKLCEACGETFPRRAAVVSSRSAKSPLFIDISAILLEAILSARRQFFSPHRSWGGAKNVADFSRKLFFPSELRRKNSPLFFFGIFCARNTFAPFIISLSRSNLPLILSFFSDLTLSIHNWYYEDMIDLLLDIRLPDRQNPSEVCPWTRSA